jgi:hypothetical protein
MEGVQIREQFLHSVIVSGQFNLAGNGKSTGKMIHKLPGTKGEAIFNANIVIAPEKKIFLTRVGYAPAKAFGTPGNRGILSVVYVEEDDFWAFLALLPRVARLVRHDFKVTYCNEKFRTIYPDFLMLSEGEITFLPGGPIQMSRALNDIHISSRDWPTSMEVSITVT